MPILESIKCQFIGSWELISFAVINPDQTPGMWAEQIKGLLTYTEQGYMSVGINGFNPGAEIKHIFYAGKYCIENEYSILHQVTVACDPEKIGTTQIRRFMIDENVLKLTGSGEFGEATLTWARIK
jgi:hypothetical protein